ncbi:MAG: hypothetical protein K2M89_06020 [Clostridiales bacterium]|nr:hypothetical protein [Clostridiales bacterium]
METSQAEVIKKCRNDLQKERIIKSVLCGMAAGFAVMFLLAFITWIFEFKGLWLSLGLGVAAWIGAALLFYFVVFSFTDMEVMKRIDRAGLDERMITMYQLRGDDSYMARRQREDASATFAAAVKKSGGQLIKTKITTAIICAASIACPFGAGMAVVTALSDYDVIPTLYELCSDSNFGAGSGSTAPTYTVTYKVSGEEDGGLLKIGDAEDGAILVSSSEDNTDKTKTDKVEKGGTAFAKAVIADGYYIEKWVDENGVEYFPNAAGYQPIVFTKDNVQKNMTVNVVFAKYDDEADLGYNYYYDPDNKNKNPDDKDHPDDNNSDKDGDPKDSPIPDDMPVPPSQGPGGGNPATPGNTIIDGETQYGENFDYFHGLAMDMLANGTDGYPPELVAAVEAYFGILL